MDPRDAATMASSALQTRRRGEGDAGQQHYASGMGRRVTWLTIYAVAMAYVESAVVVYLRALYYPQGFDFPLAPMPPGMMALEIGR